MIKQKIIQDHEQTISDLKEQINQKSGEVESGVESLYRIRDEISRLTEDLAQKELDLKKEKQEKKKILKELEVILCIIFVS